MKILRVQSVLKIIDGSVRFENIDGSVIVENIEGSVTVVQH